MKINSKIVNITALIVERSIADALANVPTYPHKVAFSKAYYQQKLLVYVLNGVRNHYIHCQGDSSRLSVESLNYFLKEQSQIETLIQEGLVNILKDDPDWMHCPEIPENVPIIYSVNRIY